MDGDDYIVLPEPVSPGNIRIEDLSNRLHFEIMIARAERAHFTALPLLSFVGDAVRPSVRNATALFDPLKIASVTPTQLDSPLSAGGEHGLHLHRIKLYGARASYAGGDLAGQGGRQRLLHTLDVRGP